MDKVFDNVLTFFKILFALAVVAAFVYFCFGKAIVYPLNIFLHLVFFGAIFAEILYVCATYFAISDKDKLNTLLVIGGIGAVYLTYRLSTYILGLPMFADAQL